MASTQPERLLTAEELFNLPDDGNRYELVEGRLVRMPPEFFLSSIIAARLAKIIGAFIDLHRLGVYGSEGGGVKLASHPDTVRAPDFTFVSSEHLPAGGITPRWYPEIVDLVIEVLSATDRFVNVLRKVNEYLAAGVRLVWVINPAERSAVVFRPNTAPRILSGDATLDGEDVIPGFSMSLSELWEGLEPEDESEV